MIPVTTPTGYSELKEIDAELFLMAFPHRSRGLVMRIQIVNVVEGGFYIDVNLKDLPLLQDGLSMIAKTTEDHNEQ